MFVLHEDTLAGMRATSVLGRLGHSLDNQPIIQDDIWKFDSLAHPALYQQALRQAQGADIIIVSASGQQPLAQYINDFLRETFEMSNRPGAVVALLDQDRRAAPVFSGLRSLAEQMGVDFLCNTSGAPKVESFHDVPVPLGE